MTSIEVTKIKQVISQDYPTIQEQLNEELDRYISTNNAKNGNHMTFVNLSFELRKAIMKVKAQAPTTQVPVFIRNKQVNR